MIKGLAIENGLSLMKLTEIRTFFEIFQFMAYVACCSCCRNGAVLRMLIRSLHIADRINMFCIIKYSCKNKNTYLILKFIP